MLVKVILVYGCFADGMLQCLSKRQSAAVLPVLRREHPNVTKPLNWVHIAGYAQGSWQLAFAVTTHTTIKKT